jgi:hypothetical protein
VNPASSSNVIIGKEYLSGLEGRLKAVEQDITLLKSKQNKPQQHTRFDDEHREESSGQNEGCQQSTKSTEEVEVNSDGLQDLLGDESGTDGMGSMVFSVEEDCGFFGKGRSLREVLSQLSTQAKPDRTILKYCIYPSYFTRHGTRKL